MVLAAMPAPAPPAQGRSSGELPTEPSSTGSSAHRWLDALHFELPATSPLGAWARVLAWTGSLVALVVVLGKTTRPLTGVRPEAPLQADAGDGERRYGLALDTRRAIFGELAKVEIAERERAISKNTWGGHLWSREDDRGHREMTAARALASRYGITLSQVYMVLDEGIRERWPGPDGAPLPPTTPPQDPRSTW